MHFRHVPIHLRTKLDDITQVIALIGYHSNGTYKRCSPDDDKLVINRDVKVDKGKSLDCTMQTSQAEQDTIRTVIEEEEESNEEVPAQEREAPERQSEDTPEQEMN